MKKLLSAILAVMMLVGCSSSGDSKNIVESTEVASMDTLDDSYYKIIKRDDKDSALREKFYLSYGGKNDFATIGRGLQLLSADYFSTKDYYMSEGQYITLTAWNQLLKRNNDKNEYPYSLQSPSGEVIDGVTNPIMVSNLYEQDYYLASGSGYEIKGVSLTIILDPEKSDGSALDTAMDSETIKAYGEKCIKTMYKFIEEDKSMKEIKDLPILITVYQATDSTKSTVNGNYILSSYCNKEVGEIKSLKYENVVFTSTRAETVDKTTATEFATIKSKLKDAATEAAGLVGVGKYENGEIQSMVMTANLNVKTYTELLYLTTILADNIDSKFTIDFDIRVVVNSQDNLAAVIIKNKGEKAKATFMY